MLNKKRMIISSENLKEKKITSSQVIKNSHDDKMNNELLINENFEFKIHSNLESVKNKNNDISNEELINDIFASNIKTKLEYINNLKNKKDFALKTIYANLIHKNKISKGIADYLRFHNIDNFEMIKNKTEELKNDQFGKLFGDKFKNIKNFKKDKNNDIKRINKYTEILAVIKNVGPAVFNFLTRNIDLENKN